MASWVIEALKLGSLGLAFLFCVLAFRLVRADETGRNPAIRPFMVLCFLSLIVAASVEVFRISSAQDTDRLKERLSLAEQRVSKLQEQLNQRDGSLESMTREQQRLTQKAERFDQLVGSWQNTLRIHCADGKAAANENVDWEPLRPIEVVMCGWYPIEYTPQ